VRFLIYTLAISTANDSRFVDFAPYVASINEQGVEALQATFVEGLSGVFYSDGWAATDVAVASDAKSPVQRFASHADINLAGVPSVYGVHKGGEEALLLYANGEMTVTCVQHSFTGIGPMGPTMNKTRANNRGQTTRADRN